MKTKMTAVTMVAVMIVAAFAVVGLADNGAADNGAADNINKHKDILGTLINPYVLNIEKTATASIEFNKSAFTNNATISFKCISTDIPHSEPISSKTATLKTNDECNDPNSTGTPKYSITLTESNGTYSVVLKGKQAHSANGYTKIDIEVSIVDKVKIDGTLITELPEQQYTFTLYLVVVNSNNDKIVLNGTDVSKESEESLQNVIFEFEKDYNISSTVYVGEFVSSDKYSYYAIGLPEGISMTVDGNIGGRLSSSLVKPTDDASFTVYAVSKSGHVISQDVNYSIKDWTNRGFEITINDNNSYTTTTVNKNVTLKITPTGGCTLKNVVVSYDEREFTPEGNITQTTTHDIQCTGTGVLKVSVSAQVEGSNVTLTKTVTVYVVGEIFNTDLDPIVTN